MAKTPDSLVFNKSEPLTLGVELELQLLNPDSLDLYPISPKIFERVGDSHPKIKAELFQSMLEINTAVCKSAHEVHADLLQTVTLIEGLSDSIGFKIASAGTHPFAHYSERILFPAPRYQDLIDRNQWIARRLMIFGLHVHIGMRSGEHAIQMNNALLHYLPLLLALSSSSPYWNAEDTELASSRITFFEALPTGGHPCRVDNWKEFLDLYDLLIKSKSIRSAKDIWWDIRPSPGFGTLEVRICDSPPTIQEIVVLTAFIHCLSRMLDEQIMKGRQFQAPPDWIMRENKWRASRWGIEADFIINTQGDTRSAQLVYKDLVQAMNKDPEVLGYEIYFSQLQELIEKGLSYKRQKTRMLNHPGDYKKLTEYLVQEFKNKKPIW